MLMAVAIDEGIVTSSRHVFCTVELYGKYTRGQMVVDWDGCLGQKPNVYVVMDVTHEIYGRMLLDSVK